MRKKNTSCILVDKADPFAPSRRPASSPSKIPPFDLAAKLPLQIRTPASPSNNFPIHHCVCNFVDWVYLLFQFASGVAKPRRSDCRSCICRLRICHAPRLPRVTGSKKPLKRRANKPSNDRHTNHR